MPYMNTTSHTQAARFLNFSSKTQIVCYIAQGPMIVVVGKAGVTEFGIFGMPGINK